MQSKRYSTLILCLIFAMFISTALSSLAVRKCVPEKSYFDGCNTCRCSPTGQEFCTYKLCSDEHGEPLARIEAPDDFWAPLIHVQPPRA